MSLRFSLTFIRYSLYAFTAAAFLFSAGCMTSYKRSVGANTQRNYSKVFLTDFDLAWQSTLDAMKSVRLDVTNREGGFLQTRWMDNTKEKNFSDGDGTTAPYMKAQYRFKVSIGSGVYQGRKAIKVTVQREQLASRDALDDFRPLESDSIEENTLLYRIGRIVSLKTRLAKIEAFRTQKEIQQATQSEGGGLSAPDLPEAPQLPESEDNFIPDAPPEEAE